MSERRGSERVEARPSLPVCGRSGEEAGKAKKNDKKEVVQSTGYSLKEKSGQLHNRVALFC